MVINTIRDDRVVHLSSLKPSSSPKSYNPTHPHPPTPNPQEKKRFVWNKLLQFQHGLFADWSTQPKKKMIYHLLTLSKWISRNMEFP